MNNERMQRYEITKHYNISIFTRLAIELAAPLAEQPASFVSIFEEHDKKFSDVHLQAWIHLLYVEKQSVADAIKFIFVSPRSALDLAARSLPADIAKLNYVQLYCYARLNPHLTLQNLTEFGIYFDWPHFKVLRHLIENRGFDAKLAIETLQFYNTKLLGSHRVVDLPSQQTKLLKLIGVYAKYSDVNKNDVLQRVSFHLPDTRISHFLPLRALRPQRVEQFKITQIFAAAHKANDKAKFYGEALDHTYYISMLNINGFFKDQLKQQCRDLLLSAQVLEIKPKFNAIKFYFEDLALAKRLIKLVKKSYGEKLQPFGENMQFTLHADEYNRYAMDPEAFKQRSSEKLIIKIPKQCLY